MTPGQVLFWLISAAIATVICVLAGKRKGRPGLGWAMGLCLGWIGVVIMLIVPKTHEAQVRDRAREMQIEQEAREWTPPAPARTIVVPLGQEPLRKAEPEPKLPKLI
jgi:hypothetical protein